MTKYAYYPGCSLENMAASYHLSALETARALDVELEELEDWNCCGATAYFHVDELLAYTLTARNLAIAEKAGMTRFVAPCSACFKNAYTTNKQLKADPELAEHINFALEADGLEVAGKLDVKHLIEVYVDEVGLDKVKERVTRPLDGLRVAPYYGCQMVRPRKEGDTMAQVENPMYFEELLSAIGATPVDYAAKVSCCGASLMITNRQAALDMVYRLLKDAATREADVIATTCPLCQVNLEVYQKQVDREYGTSFNLPVVYFTQLMGLAFGIAPGRLGIGKELISAKSALFGVRAEASN